ncbi:MAG: hypothetical protein FWE71_04450 [Nocardioidaceae bacterium]|nr:hypothetical protein [Nocardioidaceae bacterium]MCL2614564.1 hypothetical protein [Nocardioidaceae bacterium]
MSDQNPEPETRDDAVPIGRPDALDQASPWHPTHVAHLVMGLALLGLVTIWIVVVPLGAVRLQDARWLLPLPWLVAGAAGLVATVLNGRHRRRP